MNLEIAAEGTRIVEAEAIFGPVALGSGRAFAIPVADIVIGERHRQDFGDLSGLVESIAQLGLLHPIVVDGNHKLVSGERRLAAVKKLSWKTIPVTVVTKLSEAILALKAERDENIERKNFTKVEANALFNKLLELEKPSAAERQKEGQKQGGKTGGKGRPKTETDSSGARNPKAKQSESGRAKEKAAKASGYGRRAMEQVDAILKSGYKDLIDELKRTDNAKAVYEKLQARLKQKEQEEAAAQLAEQVKRNFHTVCDIRHCSMQELLATVKPDCIITDPPYPEEYLPLYGELAVLAKNVPLVAVMCGQSHLPAILETMSKHLEYRWMLAYLVPGPAVAVYPRKVNTYWKPILLFGESTAWINDVAKSKAPDKAFHEWGQSECGMGDLIERLTKPHQLVCDPFLGAGTTAVAALRLGRRFVGCDIDAGSIKQATNRAKLCMPEVRKNAQP